MKIIVPFLFLSFFVSYHKSGAILGRSSLLNHHRKLGECHELIKFDIEETYSESPL